MPTKNLGKSFASDNNAGVHPQILAAIARANSGHCVAYGDDPFTQEASSVFKKHFGPDAEAHFVFNGTAANVLALKAFTQPYHAVICSKNSHIHWDECGAPERFTGCKLLVVEPQNGKITPDGIREHLHGIGDQHHVQPRVISISQTTELGTVYSVAEIRALSELAHQNGMILHMDGARISNAAAAAGTTLRALTVDAGVDVLSFGGTKIGLLAGEAVVFFNRGAGADFKFIRKQGMQLASKMRFIAAQFTELLSSDLWLQNARHANAMAKLLESEIRKIPEVKITRNVDANAVFAILTPTQISVLQKRFYFYVWDPDLNEVRWMTSFDTTAEDVAEFARAVREVVR